MQSFHPHQPQSLKPVIVSTPLVMVHVTLIVKVAVMESVIAKVMFMAIVIAVLLVSEMVMRK